MKLVTDFGPPSTVQITRGNRRHRLSSGMSGPPARRYPPCYELKAPRAASRGTIASTMAMPFLAETSAVGTRRVTDLTRARQSAGHEWTAIPIRTCCVTPGRATCGGRSIRCWRMAALYLNDKYLSFRRQTCPAHA